MKKFLFIFMLVLVMVFSLVLCSYAETIKLRIAWWGSQNRHDRTLKAIKLFEEQNPNIDIIPEFLGWDGYWEKMAAQAAGKNLPDVWQQDYAYLMLYAKRGLLLNFNPYVENSTLNLNDVAESAISGGIVDDKLYGINLGLNAPAVVYDPELLDKAGVGEPSPYWNYEDYIAMVKELHEKLGIYGAQQFPIITYTHGFHIYLRQHGKSLYNAEGTALGYDDDQLFVDYFKMELELIKAGVIAPMDITKEISTNIEEALIVNEKAAMSDLWSNQIVALENAAGRSLKMTVLPKDKNQVQEGLFLKPSMFFSVTQYTEHSEAAVKFVDFFTNNLECNKILMAERGVPISSRIREGLKPFMGGAQKGMFDYINLAAEHSSKISPPNPEGHNQIIDLYNNLHEMIAFEVITPEDAAKEFRTKANQILSK